MTMFKMQHPQDLISRMFILEYIRDLGVDTVVDKLTEGEKNFWVYKFEGDSGKIEYDFNWEYLVFVIPIDNLSKIMERYLPEIEVIEEKRNKILNIKKQEIEEEIRTAPVDINIMSLAKAEIDKVKEKRWG